MKWGPILQIPCLSSFQEEGGERREAIGLGGNSKTATETNWKCARSDDELKPELQITTHHSMQHRHKIAYRIPCSRKI